MRLTSVQVFFLLVSAGLAIGAAYLLVIRRPRGAVWGAGEMVGGLLAVFAAALTLGALFITRTDLTIRDLAPLVIGQNAVLVLVVLYVVRVRYRQPLARAGLTLRRLGAMVALGLALGAPIIAVSQYGGQWITRQALTLRMGPAEARAYMEREQASNEVVRVLGRTRETPNPGDLALAIVLLAGLVPIGEETFFRGLVYTGLRARWAAAAAVAASAVLFSLLHVGVVTFVPIVMLGSALALLFDRTGSLAPSMVVHAMNNLLAVLGTYYRWNI